MSKLRKRSKKLASQKQKAQTIRNGLIALIGFLIVALLVLIFRVGEGLWWLWLVDHRTQIIGLLALITVSLICLSPIMIEASAHTRTLSGPGKTYHGSRFFEE